MIRNPGKDFSLAQEKEIAKFLGGRVQSNSGGTRFGGGDVHTELFFIEAKAPTKSQTSFSIQKTWIDKMREQAFEQGKRFSALAFRFEPDGEDHFVIPRTLMKYLIQKMEEEDT